MTMLALKLDQQLLEGTGTAPQIRGLKNIVGIQSLASATNGQNPTYDNFSDTLALLEAVNVPAERVSVILHNRNIGKLRSIKASGTGEYLGGPAQGATPTGIWGRPYFTTSQLSVNETQGTSTDCNSAYLIDTANVVYVRRTDVEIEIDRSRLFDTDRSEIRAKLRGDLIAPAANAVVRLTGLRNI
jgi:HK97 family phage major capsid protein